ncbi:cytidylate kinase-like family protein [Faecalicatena contorta]|uniref:cytidylate kinase-like family protein n=1 Tax=Faecalicatena contorta TaxID=39482 RepID=UPI00195FD325|nr:cytidylate kinase-like family protein [Faecalicatena contorta]MBM6685623.1 cytidylate kinase-like family protein [Faecalicatena contorta]MBM6711163.1 cytidylate kinase-like family protein [Faecalicatena contorta]
MKKIITIGREFGSGGHEIGERLSKRLNYTLYDREIIDEAAKKSGINVKELQRYDEKAMNSLLYSLVLGNYYKRSENSPLEQPVAIRIEQAYFSTIKSLAEKGPCIIVGRCADYILKDNENRLSFFITADEKKRVARIKDKYGVTEAEAVKLINKNDRNRSNYYKSITGKAWGMAENYDFCIRSSYYGIDSTVEIITKLIE